MRHYTVHFWTGGCLDSIVVEARSRLEAKEVAKLEITAQGWRGRIDVEKVEKGAWYP